jgi:hypothetical protein
MSVDKDHPILDEDGVIDWSRLSWKELELLKGALDRGLVLARVRAWLPIAELDAAMHSLRSTILQNAEAFTWLPAPTAEPREGFLALDAIVSPVASIEFLAQSLEGIDASVRELTLRPRAGPLE